MKTNAVALERHNLGELAVIEHLADTIGIQAFRHSGIQAFELTFRAWRGFLQSIPSNRFKPVELSSTQVSLA